MSNSWMKRTLAGWAAAGLDFNDRAKFTVKSRKERTDRRNPTPNWAMDNYKLRKLIVVFMEERAGIKQPRKSDSVKARLEAAIVMIASKRTDFEDRMNRLCRDYVEIKNKGVMRDKSDEEINAQLRQPFFKFAEGMGRQKKTAKKLKILETEIEGLDTYLRMTANGGADVIAAIVYLYYRLGMDSVAVAQQLRLKPGHCRQILYRLQKTWSKKLAHEYEPARKGPSPLDVYANKVKDS